MYETSYKYLHGIETRGKIYFDSPSKGELSKILDTVLKVMDIRGYHVITEGTNLFQYLTPMCLVTNALEYEYSDVDSDANSDNDSDNDSDDRRVAFYAHTESSNPLVEVSEILSDLENDRLLFFHDGPSLQNGELFDIFSLVEKLIGEGLDFEYERLPQQIHLSNEVRNRLVYPFLDEFFIPEITKLIQDYDGLERDKYSPCSLSPSPIFYIQ